MSLKQTIKRFLPPILIETARRVFPATPPVEQPEWEYIEEGWSARDPKIKGWNVESVLETQKAKWPQFLISVQGTGPLGISHEASTPSNSDYAPHNTLMAYAYVLAMAARKKVSLSLLDWGGGIGHYYVISKALIPDIKIDYHCKDLPLLCQQGRIFLPEASFHDDEESCFKQSYDLVLASASLHYREDWKSALARLASVSRSYLYVTRLPIVHQAPSFAVVQRPYRYGYQTEYIGWFLNRKEFLDHASALQMKLVREFLINERPRVHKAPEQGEYRGFLFCPGS